MIRQARLWGTRDGCALVITDVPLRALVLDRVMDRISNWALWYTSSPQGQWLWKVGFTTRWSVGWFLHDVGEFPLLYMSRREKKIAKIPLSDEEVERDFPGLLTGRFTPASIVGPPATVHVVFAQREGAWHASSPELSDVKEQGGSLDELRERVRNRLAEWLRPDIEVIEYVEPT